MSWDVNTWLPVLTLLLGSSGGILVALRKDRREGKSSNADLLKTIREMATAEVTRADDQMKKMQARVQVLEARDAERVLRDQARQSEMEDLDARLNDERRRSQALEAALQAAGIPIPPWPPETQLAHLVERRGEQTPIDFEDRRKDSRG